MLCRPHSPRVTLKWKINQSRSLRCTSTECNRRCLRHLVHSSCVVHLSAILTPDRPPIQHGHCHHSTSSTKESKLTQNCSPRAQLNNRPLCEQLLFIRPWQLVVLVTAFESPRRLVDHMLTHLGIRSSMSAAAGARHPLIRCLGTRSTRLVRIRALTRKCMVHPLGEEAAMNWNLATIDHGDLAKLIHDRIRQLPRRSNGA